MKLIVFHRQANFPLQGLFKKGKTQQRDDKAINPLISPSVHTAHIRHLSAGIIYSH